MVGERRVEMGKSKRKGDSRGPKLLGGGENVYGRVFSLLGHNKKKKHPSLKGRGKKKKSSKNAKKKMNQKELKKLLCVSLKGRCDQGKGKGVCKESPWTMRAVCDPGAAHRGQ